MADKDIQFVTADAQKITSDLITDFQAFTGEVLYPGDERRIFLQNFSYILVDIYNNINETAKDNLLTYSSGQALDELGELYSNKRKPALQSKVTMEFNLSNVPQEGVSIPQGTRVTPDGKLFFLTDKTLLFAKSEGLTKSVEATAEKGGTDYNGFNIGQINKLVDGNIYVSSVRNTSISSGGTNIETDDMYRERLKTSPFAFSVAGPKNAYESIALNSSSDIADVEVYSSTPGQVDIAVLEKNGRIPESHDLSIALVEEACNADNVRPLTDKVVVAPCVARSYNINVNYYIPKSRPELQSQMEYIVANYINWQSEKIGRAINPDKLRVIMLQAGCSRVEVVSPIYTEIRNNEVAKLGSKTITYKGTTEE